MKKEKEKAVPWTDFWEELCREDEKEVRPFSKLLFGKKLKRIFHEVKDFIYFRVWGGKFRNGGLTKLWYWIRCHTYNRYHIIDVGKYSRDAGDGYRWGWCDRDHAMFLACFHLLVEFIELEKPFEWIDYEHDEEHRQRKIELVTLYEWWKTGRKQEHTEVAAIINDDRPLRERYNGPAWEEWKRRSDELEAKDDEMLARLMKIRHHLWT